MTKVIARTLASDWIWPLFFWFAKNLSSIASVERLFQRVLYERFIAKQDWIEAFLREHVPDLAVAAGPMAGLTYPRLESKCSTLAPKLLGTYEAEIADFFDPQPMADYQRVVDIGCAEGFYAVGAAIIDSNFNVDAYDISSDAQTLCGALAEFNGVSDRVHIESECTADSLRAHRDQRVLIISDCEGAEMNLFDIELISDLPKADFVIEVHEHLGASGEELAQRFEATHHCLLIPCLTDLQRLATYHPKPLAGLSESDKVVLLAECRSKGNGWLIATPK